MRLSGSCGGWDALIALVFVVFFVWGLVDGSVSSFNLVLWIGILAALGGVLAGVRGSGTRAINALPRSFCSPLRSPAFWSPSSSSH